MDEKERVDFATRVFAEHEPAIRRMIQRHTRNADEADDLYQNLYLALVQSTTPCTSSNVLAYLETVIRHDVIDGVRRRKKREEVISRYRDRVVAKTVKTPEEKAIHDEQLQQVRDYIRSLPEHEARVLIERFERGRTTAETAKERNVKVRTISRYLSVALNRLRNALTKREVEQGLCR